MGWEFATETKPVARKDYHCEASDWIDNTTGWDEEEFAEEDRETIRKARAEGCKVLKGTQYVKVTGKFEGEFSTFRARADLNDICQRYDLYPDD
ncbi:MAG: hypothetical protein OIF55_16695 [Amphritea sp.]|nr:hypothetical protein [Amphritea sp.]